MKLKITAILILLTFIAACKSEPSFLTRKPVKVNSPLIQYRFARIQTSMGEIKLELHWAAAPNTCLNFATMVNKKYFEGIIFHRVIKDFMIQTGGYTETGYKNSGIKLNDEIDADSLGLNRIDVDSAYRGRKILKKDIDRMIGVALNIKTRAEAAANRGKIRDFEEKVMNWSVKKLFQTLGIVYTKGLPSKKALRGSVAMANRGPDTNGTQFFINVVNTPWLNGKHTVFASVAQGLDIADNISRVNTSKKGKPKKTITIISIELLRN